MVPKDEGAIIMKSVLVTTLLVGPWHWAVCFPYIDQGLNDVLRLTQLVSQALRMSSLSSNLVLQLASLPSVALIPSPVQGQILS